MGMSNKSLSQNMHDINFKVNKEGLKKVKSFTLNFGPQHPAAHGVFKDDTSIKRRSY